MSLVRDLVQGALDDATAKLATATDQRDSLQEGVDRWTAIVADTEARVAELQSFLAGFTG